MSFVHLHNHTQYSLLKGALRMTPLLQTVARFNMDACAITDHCNLFGAIDFYSQAKEFGIKPIIGCEVNVEREGHSGLEGQKNILCDHLVLLAMDFKGYQNLCRLVSIAHENEYLGVSYINKETLEKYSQGLICLSGGLQGEIPRLILESQLDKAMRETLWYQKVFQNRYYLELQRHGLKQESRVEPHLKKLSHDFNIPLVATNNCHYLKQEEAQYHDVLLCIAAGRTLNNRVSLHSDQFYLKSVEEMQELFKDIPQAIKNTQEISSRCQVDFKFHEYQMPHFAPPEGKTLDNYFTELALQGLYERFKHDEILESTLREKYTTRLKEEITIICNMGFSGYFLIVADFVSFARKKGIPVGVGRGSAVGSLVAYSLGIIDIDPLKYDLIFERFLNPERVSMPDVDMDFCQDRRDEVIEYVCSKYGREKVAHIITFGTLQAKGVIRDVGRVFGLPYTRVDAIAKLVPNVLGITLKDAFREEPKLLEIAETDKTVKQVLECAEALEGLYRHASIHAAGVVISNQDMVNLVPLFKGKEGEVVTQYDMKNLEKLGLIKFDFLGLKTLTVIDNAIKLIRGEKNPQFDLRKISVDDHEIYKQIARGDTMGLFQFESRGMRDLCLRVQPHCLSDLIAINALFRPGPLGRVDEFIDRKHGRMKLEYELPELEETLKETYGVMLYQEQVMKVAHKLANYSLGEADLLRRAMGKKIPKEMAKQKVRFLEGAKQNKIDLNTASTIFDQMAKFAEYGFNKSHSAAYAYIGYQTAYLKHYYPLEFFAALMTTEMENEDKLTRYIKYCLDEAIPVYPPDIYKSSYTFKVEGEGIRFGLGGIKNIGAAAIEALIEARQMHKHFRSLYHLCEVVDLRRVNKKILENLIKAGALDSLGATRAQMMEVLVEAMDQGVNLQKDKMSGQTNLFGALSGAHAKEKAYPEIPEWPKLQKLYFEKQTLGIYLTGHPLEDFTKHIAWYTPYHSQNLKTAEDKSEIRLGGIVNHFKELRTKKNRKMAFVSLGDMEGDVEIIVFSELYEQKRILLQKQTPLIFSGTVGKKQDQEPKLIAHDMWTLQDYIRVKTRSVHVGIRSEAIGEKELMSLKDILKKFPGSCHSFFHFNIKGEKEAIMKLPDTLKVSPAYPLVHEVEKILGENSIWFAHS